MATIRPFSGIRYNEKDISRLICPPYDIISPEEKERLKNSSPFNMVRLELPDPSGNRDKYREAGRLLREWLSGGIFSSDEKPAFYFYEQSFKDSGKRKVRRGFFAALKLENPHGGAVKPHERTLAKPKADRLKLLRAVQANLSPIFGLFNDPGKKVMKMAAKISSSKPGMTAKDREGVTHRLWKVDDDLSVQSISKALLPRKIFIADGHHRYETAWNYFQELKKKGKKIPAGAASAHVLAFLCPMEDPGLSLWPTHRVVELPRDVEERIEKYFDVLPAAVFAKRSGVSPQPFLLFHNGIKRTLAVKSRKILDKAMPGKVKAYRELGVSILHSLLIPDVPPERITYVKSEAEAYKLAQERKVSAIIVPATPVRAVKEIALANQTMPQKSTYFYPKLASGVVIHSLADGKNG